MDNVKLVSKNFYERCSTIFNKECHRLRINIPKLDDPIIFNAMKFSLRRFSYLQIVFDHFSPEHYKKTNELLEIFGASVEILNLYGLPRQGRTIKQSTLIKWLNLMPNIIIIHGGRFTESILDDDATSLNLAHLREVHFCSLALGLKLHLLPSSLLTTLKLSEVVLPNLPQIFERHRNTLRKLWFDDIAGYSNPGPFRLLQLNFLVCFYHQQVDPIVHEEFLFRLLEHQTQLKVLKISEVWAGESFQISPRILHDICKKTELEQLMMHFSREITAADVLAMRNLRKLKELSIDMFSPGRLRAGEINEQNDMILQTICSSGLVELTSIHLETYIGRLSLNLFLDSFPKLKSLQLQDSKYSFTPGRTYNNMVKLWLSCYTMDLMPCLIKSMPNLQDIYFASLFPRVSTVQEIFKSKATEVDLTIRMIEGLSVYKERKLRKICKKFKEKSEEEERLFLIEFRVLDY